MPRALGGMQVASDPALNVDKAGLLSPASRWPSSPSMRDSGVTSFRTQGNEHTKPDHSLPSHRPKCPALEVNK